jgi:hypothetical protein
VVVVVVVVVLMCAQHCCQASHATGNQRRVETHLATSCGAPQRAAAQVFCGMLSRIWQFSDILQHAKQHQQQQQQGQLGQGQAQQQLHTQPPLQPPASSSSSSTAARARRWAYAILGDLNTMAHGVARLSPHYCCDAMRWRSLGSSEAAFWQRHVLSVTGGGAAAACGCVRTAWLWHRIVGLP